MRRGRGGVGYWDGGKRRERGGGGRGVGVMRMRRGEREVGVGIETNIDVTKMRRGEVIEGAGQGHGPDLERGRDMERKRGRGMEANTGIPDDAHDHDPGATIGGGIDILGTGERGASRRSGDGGRGRVSDGDRGSRYVSNCM